MELSLGVSKQEFLYDHTGLFSQARSYNKAQEIKNAQDTFCAKALAGQLGESAQFPEDLQWEALVDVLRGKVKVHNHCYEAVDLDNMVRVSIGSIHTVICWGYR